MKVTFYCDEYFMDSQLPNPGGCWVNGKQIKLDSKFVVKHFSPTDVLRFPDMGLYYVYIMRSDGKFIRVLDKDTGESTSVILENGYDYVVFACLQIPSKTTFDGWVAVTMNSFGTHNIYINGINYATVTINDVFYVPRGTKIFIDGYVSGVPQSWILDPDVSHVIVTERGTIEGDH